MALNTSDCDPSRQPATFSIRDYARLAAPDTWVVSGRSRATNLNLKVFVNNSQMSGKFDLKYLCDLGQSHFQKFRCQTLTYQWLEHDDCHILSLSSINKEDQRVIWWREIKLNRDGERNRNGVPSYCTVMETGGGQVEAAQNFELDGGQSPPKSGSEIVLSRVPTRVVKLSVSFQRFCGRGRDVAVALALTNNNNS